MSVKTLDVLEGRERSIPKSSKGDQKEEEESPLSCRSLKTLDPRIVNKPNLDKSSDINQTSQCLFGTSQTQSQTPEPTSDVIAAKSGIDYKYYGPQSMP